MEPRGACQGKPRRIDAWSRGSGHLEVVHQCRPHCKKEGGVLPWWLLIGTPSAKRYTMASQEKNWGELHDAYKEKSRVAGGRTSRKPKPSGK